ncbi:MAG: adenylyltransferase/cytidyltransferase family protein [Candidatus Micrarchaeota archaeon]
MSAPIDASHNYLRKARLLEIEDGFIAPKLLPEIMGLEKEGFAREVSNNRFELTEAGRKEVSVVLTGGVFDILHPGHIFTLEKAREFGELLVVIIASDETVRKIKSREPFHVEEERRKIVSALKPVDLAIVGAHGNRLETVKRVHPNAIVFGYDQAMEWARVLENEGIKMVKLENHLHEHVFKTSRIRAILEEEAKKEQTQGNGSKLKTDAEEE